MTSESALEAAYVSEQIQPSTADFDQICGVETVMIAPDYAYSCEIDQSPDPLTDISNENCESHFDKVWNNELLYVPTMTDGMYLINYKF